MNIAEKLTAIAENQQKVYDAGRQAEHDEFWEEYTNNGARDDYSRAFEGPFWTQERFTPNVVIQPTIANYMFLESRVTDITNVDFVSRLTGTYQMCRNCTTLKYVGNIKPNHPNASQIFYGCSNLISVGTLTVTSDIKYDVAFYECGKLTDITFEGVIGNSLDMSACPLNRASIESIISCLSATASGKTLTLKSGQVDTTFETSEGTADGRAVFESLIAEKTNWKFSY